MTYQGSNGLSKFKILMTLFLIFMATHLKNTWTSFDEETISNICLISEAFFLSIFISLPWTYLFVLFDWYWFMLSKGSYSFMFESSFYNFLYKILKTVYITFLQLLIKEVYALKCYTNVKTIVAWNITIFQKTCFLCFDFVSAANLLILYFVYISCNISYF